MIEWVAVETTKGTKRHAIDPESPLRAGIYRRALCGYEVAVRSIVDQDDAVLCKGCEWRWMSQSCGHTKPVFGCASCIEASRPPMTDKGEKPWACPNCGESHPYSRMVCNRVFKKGGLVEGWQGCGYDRRTGRVPE